MAKLVDVGTAMLDRGHDAERIHEMIRSASAISIMPARNGDIPIWRTGGFYRKQMKRDFSQMYGENRDDILGDQELEVRSKSPAMIEKELLFLVLAYNSQNVRHFFGFFYDFYKARRTNMAITHKFYC